MLQERFSLIRNLFVSRISFNQYQISGHVKIKRIDYVCSLEKFIFDAMNNISGT